MSDQPIQFVEDNFPAYPVRPPARPVEFVSEAPSQPVRRQLSYLATLDRPLVVVMAMLLALGAMMIFSATFDWSLIEFGSETAVFFDHLRNLVVGLVAMIAFSLFDLRILRRLAIIIMLLAISFLIAVLLFGDDTFGARRALIDGRFQPGEFSELATIIYMAAWLGSKRMRVRSLTYGLIPFVTLVAIVAGLVILQPDLSTAAVIFTVSALMFFLAGADMRQILFAGVMIAIFAVVTLTTDLLPAYATERITGYVAGITDLTRASYHTQQAIISLRYGGWTGIGLGQSEGKFLALPAPHTDSIFAVIGEELGVVGTLVVVILYIAFVIRGFQISRRSTNAFSALLAAGITLWVAIKAVLNIAVMTALVPPTGLPLPFISYGGSSLVVLLVGVGLLLAIQRETTLLNQPERRSGAYHDRVRRDGGTRVPGTRHSRGSRPAVSK